ncbi:MAG: glycosyltransferase family 2 protein [Ruminococcus sp.]|nr:glycosyltransferase family 2 protein [Ruminococcus sp.]
MLSIIIPSYNEEGNVENTANVVSEIMMENKIDYELVFVNDGSKDKTWEKLTQLTRSMDNIVAINFSRNFGKESAIFAGLKEAKGDACVLMDCDLQHPPKTIIEMYNIWKNNPDIDIVEAKKADRGKENPIYKCFSLLFYKLIRKASGLEMKDASDFKLLDRRVVDQLNEMPERLTFFRAMSNWVGYNTATVYFEVQERFDGESKWSVKSLIKYAINSITAFTSAPLQLVTIIGALMFICAVVLGIQTLVMKFMGHSATGFTTVILLLLFIGSMIMISLGIIGHYLAKIYEEIKQRPRYIVRDRLSSKKNGD